MQKYPARVIPIAILQAAGLSIFAGFQFLSAGVRSIDKALILLGILWAGALAALLVFHAIPAVRRRVEALPGRTYLIAALVGLAAAGLLTAVSPIPRPKDPANWQAIEIRPLPLADGGGAGTKLVLVEIKLDGQPLPLEEWNGAGGWQLTESGLESAAAEASPLLIQRRGALEDGAALLLGKSPRGGPAALRLGWAREEIDTHQTGAETQVEVRFPAQQQAPWAALHLAGQAVSAWALILAAMILFLPAGALEKLAAGAANLSRSAAFWILAAFTVCYAAFFFQPVFLSPANMMKLENNLPAIYPIGNDLHLIMDAAESLASGGSPYAGANKYPPLASAVFTALLGMNIRDAFRVLSTANLVFFIFLSLGAPLWLAEERRLKNFTWMVFTAGLFSYGFLFEVERGQFNLAAVGLALLAVILYHRAPRLKWLAFALFCVGVQLKIYPAVFVFFFTRDWRDWKRNLTRWAGLEAANLALLMALGWKVFADFISMMTRVVSELGMASWPVSHSINGFVSFWGSHAAWAQHSARALQIILYLAMIGFTALCAWSAVRRRQVLDPYLILACTLLALTLPSLSNDYTLAFLAGPAVLFFSRAEDFTARAAALGRRGLWPLLAAAALAFSSTFFSYLVKPPLLQNQFPALIVMLVCAAWFSMLEVEAS